MATESVAFLSMSNEVQISYIKHYIFIGSLTLLIYDYFLTFTSEVKLIWHSRLSLVKVLYLLSRYSAFIDAPLLVFLAIYSQTNLPPNDCLRIFYVLSCSILFGVGFTEMILVLRTSALWGRNLKVLWGLSGLLAALFTLCSVTTYIFLHSSAVIPSSTQIGCNISVPRCSEYFFLNFVSITAFEIVVVALTTHRWYYEFRDLSSPLVVTLHRDGILFFLCLNAISLVNVFVLKFASEDYSNVAILTQRVFHCILSCRIILHARESDHGMTGSSYSRPISLIWFEEPEEISSSSSNLSQSKHSIT